jgi:hypothetical protein
MEAMFTIIAKMSAMNGVHISMTFLLVVKREPI